MGVPFQIKESTAPNTIMEPEHHPFGKKQYIPNLHFWGSSS